MSSSKLGEFGRIGRFFRPLTENVEIARDLLDDAAVVASEAGRDLVVTTDAMVEGVHYLPGEPPGRLARKLLRVNLSDLAAMAAEPCGYLLTLALPRTVDDDWVAGFADGLAADQRAYGVTLWGGDSVSTAGPPVLSITAFGSVPTGGAVGRSGACPGDRIWASGALGDARLGLALLQGDLVPAEGSARLVARYHLPEPRLETGRELRGVATALLDLSDGLPGDAARIAEASGVRLVIEAGSVPVSEAARAHLSVDGRIFRLLLGGGDDYELLFTAPESAAAAVEALAGRTGVPLTPIGRVETGAGVTILDEGGRALEGLEGWQHF